MWADQRERLARIEAALTIAARDPPRLDRGDAAAWLVGRLAEPRAEGQATIVSHSIALQYFPEMTRAAVRDAMEREGGAATPERPLGWLRYEIDPEFDGHPSLRLRLWPGGPDRILALVDAHARAVRWKV